VLPAGDDPERGCAVVRLRRRGSALECAVVELLTPDRRTAHQALEPALDSGADYLIATASPLTPRSFLPVPGIGPVLTWRPVAVPGTPTRAQLGLSLGDVELF
jgi:hypothetical protein